jgi:polar amino acid transport system substrate-binding protein
MKRCFAVCVIGLLGFVLAAVNVSAGPVLDRIVERGELVVGTTGTQPPLSATTKDNKIIGLDADLAKLMASSIGVNIRFETIPFSELLPALEAGKVDMVLSSMTITPERNLKVAFIGPYYISGKGLLTKGQNVAAIQAAEGLNKPEFSVGALANSTSQKFVEQTMPKAKMITGASYEELVSKLLKDEINVLIADYPFCALTAFRYRDVGLTAGEARFTFEPLGIAVTEDPLLINLVENYLNILQGSGKLRVLTERWFTGGDWVGELK